MRSTRTSTEPLGTVSRVRSSNASAGALPSGFNGLTLSNTTEKPSGVTVADA